MIHYDSLWEELHELNDSKQASVLRRLFGYLEASDRKEELEVINRVVKELASKN